MVSLVERVVGPCTVCGAREVVRVPDHNLAVMVAICARCLWRVGRPSTSNEHWIASEADLRVVLGRDAQFELDCWMTRLSRLGLVTEWQFGQGVSICLEGSSGDPDMCLEVEFPTEVNALIAQIEDLDRRAASVEAGLMREELNWGDEPDVD